MSVTPDIAGFIDASKRLRSETGSAITFMVPQASTWPPGTRINPDTGEPYDAMVQPTSAPLQVTITCSVILKEASPLRPQADAQFSALGLASGMDLILDVDAADYPRVQGAADFTYATKSYHIEEWKPFELAGTVYRWLCYGMEH